jgi:hypothetical protein
MLDVLFGFPTNNIVKNYYSKKQNNRIPIVVNFNFKMLETNTNNSKIIGTNYIKKN